MEAPAISPPTATTPERLTRAGMWLRPTTRTTDKGNWGDSNTARSVVLSDGLSEEAIYDAMKNYRVYATEDNDLSILYSLKETLWDPSLTSRRKSISQQRFPTPTDTAGETKVEVFVNGGQTLAEKTLPAAARQWSLTAFPPDTVTTTCE